MAQFKPSLPKGTRDFIPGQALRRKYIFNAIEEVFLRYGYSPIETPAMENLSTLTGKYGNEGDRLIFKILNSGDFLKGIEKKNLNESSPAKLSGQICEKGLRYDLTVPFARFVVQNYNEITFPFKRYQIQPVWRADRPQKGRYREFYQCDVDVIGSTSLLNETELIMIMDEVFEKLKIDVVIKLNHRKILAGLAEFLNKKERLTELTVALDKRAKIGDEKVLEELRQLGFNQKDIGKLKPFLDFEGNTEDKIGFLREQLGHTVSGEAGVREMGTIFSFARDAGVDTKCRFDFTLARGLDYYTGIIFEVEATRWSGGSICGGGRYDDLTGIFGLENMSGVGVSFGADRIYDVLEQTGKFPEENETTTQVLCLNFGQKEVAYILPLVRKMRDHRISVEIYPDAVKLKKQMQYANQKNIPFVILTGAEEMAANEVSLKNMSTGEQKRMTFERVVTAITKG